MGEFSKSMLTQAAKLKESNSYVSPRSASSSTEEETPNESGGSGSTQTPSDEGEMGE